MSDRLHARLLGTALLAALALTACKRDGLADGATDSPSANDGSTNVGPGAPPVDSASPADGNSASQPAAGPSGRAAGPTLVLVPQGPHGAYVANGAGNALYYVDGDMDGSKCTGPCVQSWPPVTVDAVQPSGGPGLQGAMISTITRPDGSRQVTFDGHPLYRYSADAGAGATNGDGVKDKFGTWHLAAAPTGAGDAATPGGPSSGGTGASSAAPAGGSSTPQGGTSG